VSQAKTLIELLAPAKDLHTGIAAISSGADAVYIGANRFGAREAVGNSIVDIESLVKFAHRYWAKVYITINTLLRDDELPDAVSLIHQLYSIGIDALIIQDLGLLECDLPPIPLFASTQMHNHTRERVQFLEQVGFHRVILARELSLEEILQIKSETKIELETFVHGSLCVSYSGQCYLSWALGGRSGNRGQCAQPCRRRYRLVDKQGTLIADRYLLSLHDLNLTNELEDLLNAGVTSFKIEGRLKDRSYIINTVSHYRQKLDQIFEGHSFKKASSGLSNPGFIPDLQKTFHRGFTSYFIKGRGVEISSPASPKWIGEFIGRVLYINQDFLILQDPYILEPGDGLTFFNELGELCGTSVNRIENQKIFVEKIKGISKGTQIFRNHDHSFLSNLDKSQPERLIDITLELSETADGYSLTAEDEDNNEGVFQIRFEKKPANLPETTRMSIEKQLLKMGGTEFRCVKLHNQTSREYFLPLSSINFLRRGALDSLRQTRHKNRPTLISTRRNNEVPFPSKSLSFEANILNSKAKNFFQRHGVVNIEAAAETGLNLHGRKVMTTHLCLRSELGVCLKNAQSTHFHEPLSLIDENNQILQLRFNCLECVMEIYRQ